tara:strand:+ start:131 stop:454 length:324 start_codon:yes stop_codon:yes gene_type:complete
MKIFFTFFILLSTMVVSYASFPVTENGTNHKTDLVSFTQDASEDATFYEMLTTAPTEFHFGGFLLGLLLGLIGVALAYIFSQDADFRRNSWYGLGTWLILILLLAGV